LKLKTHKEIKDAFNNATLTNETILSNNIKKGDIIKEIGLEWYGEILDNRRGNIRIANIYGIYTEIGSIYIWDIDKVCKDGKIYTLKLTKKQMKDYKRVKTFLE